MKKKKICAILMTILLTIVPASVSYARSEEFTQMYDSLMEEFSGVEFNEENTISMLGLFEMAFPTFANMSEWPTDETNTTILSGLMACLCYMDMYYPEDQPGYKIAQSGLDAVEALYLGDESFHEKVEILASTYNEITGTALYATTFPEGQWKVGMDIPAGEYILFSDSEAGYFCVSADANSSNIIANDNFDYNSIITVNDGEYINLTRCYAVPADDVKSIGTEKGNMFKVGTHIPSGEYKIVTDSDMGYYAIYNDSRHQDIVANNNFQGQSYVTVSDGQYLLLSRCHIEQQ